MMDNFRELAETQLQCAVCSEVFVEATAINCGHTFCHFCIHEWKKKKSNCPVCRTDIKQIVAVKVPTEHHVSDIGTKSMSEKRLRMLIKLAGMENVEEKEKTQIAAGGATAGARRVGNTAHRAGGVSDVIGHVIWHHADR